MRRAFLFSVIFVLLFTVFLLLSAFYLKILQSSEIDIAQAGNITKVVYTRDDIATDLLDYLQLAVNIESDSTNTILNISDVLSSPYSNPNSSLNSYKSIINGTYSNQTNLLDPSTNLSVISLNTTSFESSPSLNFLNSNSSLNLRYSYNNLSKNELIINGSSLTRNYLVTARLDNTCMNNNCTNATFAGGPPTVDNSTRGMWHFDEVSGTTTADSSGNGNTAELSGTIEWVGGRFKSGLRFISSDLEQLVINDSASLNITGNLTVELWFKTIPIDSYGWILNKCNVSLSYTDDEYSVYITPENKIICLIANGTAFQQVVSSAAIQPDVWYHVACTADGSNLTIYINGLRDNSTLQTLTPTPNNYALFIGAQNDEMLLYHFNGTIDEVAIYSRAKSADEIYSDANVFHWDWGPIAINSNISAAWHFDEGSGNTTADSSGNGNIVTLNGTQTITLQPSSTNKAYNISSASADNPFLATAEMDYSKISASDDVRDNSSASYSNTFSRSCQAGTCSCKGSSNYCWSQSLCINSAGCTASCPSAGNATTTGNSCSLWIGGCLQGCVSCIT